MSTTISTDWESNEEINIFREYLRIPSVHPDVNYDACVSFLRRQAHSLQLPIQVHSVGGNPRFPFAVITWTGSDPTQGAVLLNSHMDVVPVYRDTWSHDPFGAEIDADGRIFARGAQDMKCVGTQYLGAIRELQRQGFVPKRTIHVLFVPDEEIGGKSGMRQIVKSDEFRNLNVAFALDERIASETDKFPIYYAERSAWFVNITINGTTGHGSILHKGTAGEKVASLLANFSRYRAETVRRMEENPLLTMGDVTSINLTMISGGVHVNIVPTSMKVSFDIRLSLDVNHGDFENMLNNWCSEAGENVTIEYPVKSPFVEPTKLDETNPFWMEFEKATKELNLEITPQVFVGATDSRYVREIGIPAIGFSPINQTPVLLHDNDEYLGATTYLRGIEIYTKLLSKISNA